MKIIAKVYIRQEPQVNPTHWEVYDSYVVNSKEVEVDVKTAEKWLAAQKVYRESQFEIAQKAR